MCRNKTQDLIREAKRHHFSASIVSQKDTRIIWKHLRTLTKNDDSSSNTLPDEIKIDNETYSNSGDIASKLNEYFASVCDHFCGDPVDAPDFNKLNDYVNSKVPSYIRFSIPHITIQQVFYFKRLHVMYIRSFPNFI